MRRPACTGAGAAAPTAVSSVVSPLEPACRPGGPARGRRPRRSRRRCRGRTRSIPRPATSRASRRGVVQSVTWVSTPVSRSLVNSAESSIWSTGTRPGLRDRQNAIDRSSGENRGCRSSITRAWRRGDLGDVERGGVVQPDPARDREAVHRPAERLEERELRPVVRPRGLVPGPARLHARDDRPGSAEPGRVRLPDLLASSASYSWIEHGSAGSPLGRYERPR